MDINFNLTQKTMKKLKKYQAWARKNKNFQFVITEIKAFSIKDARKYFHNEGYELDSKVYLKT